MDNFYVYMYLRSKNSKHGKAGSPYYVGKGKGMRAYSKDHRVRPPVDKSMIAFAARNLSESAAFALEMSLIAQHGRIDNGTGCLRNRTDGGDGQSGLIHSLRTRSLLSKWMKEHPNRGNAICPSWPLGKKRGPQSEQTKRNRAEALRGRKHSEQTRRKISEAIRLAISSPEVKARMSQAALKREAKKREQLQTR